MLLTHNNKRKVLEIIIIKERLIIKGFEEQNHPTYSPDLAHIDFYLLRNLKKQLRGKRFEYDEEMKSATEQRLESREENFYLRGIQELQTRWNMCIDVNGDYVSKFNLNSLFVIVSKQLLRYSQSQKILIDLRSSIGDLHSM